MNFLITTNADYKNNFDLNKISHNKVDIYYDDNWTVGEYSLIKGTSNNYCKIEFKDSINITHNDLRDFPLFYDAESCSNFIKLDSEQKSIYKKSFKEKEKKLRRKSVYKTQLGCFALLSFLLMTGKVSSE